MKRPLIKDGVVINIVEIGDDVEVMARAPAKRAFADEEAQHSQRMLAWRQQCTAMYAEAQAEHDTASLAFGSAEQLKAQSANEKNPKRAQSALQAILAAEAKGKDHVDKYNALRARPLPPKPRLTRAKRWFHDDGLELGPPGGDRGDLWDGRKYTKPDQAA